MGACGVQAGQPLTPQAVNRLRAGAAPSHAASIINLDGSYPVGMGPVMPPAMPPAMPAPAAPSATLPPRGPSAPTVPPTMNALDAFSGAEWDLGLGGGALPVPAHHHALPPVAHPATALPPHVLPHTQVRLPAQSERERERERD
jgi:hypothetical protein